MRNGIDYTKKDDIILETLRNGCTTGSFIKHQDSSYGFDDIKSKLDSMGVSYTDSYDEWCLGYSLFAHKHKEKIEVISGKSKSCWDDMTNSKKYMIEALESAGWPECCTKQLRIDHEKGLNTRRRYALQLVGLSKKYNFTASDRVELSRIGRKLQDKLKNMYENKDTLKTVDKDKWITQETESVDEDKETETDLRIEIEIKETNREKYQLNIDGMTRTVLNTRLSKELPMCNPECKEMYEKVTSRRLESVRKMGYDIKEVSQNTGDLVEADLYNYYWPEIGQNASLRGLGEIIDARAVENIYNVSEITPAVVKESVIKLKRNDEEVIGRLKLA